jgi:hypothetical protein
VELEERPLQSVDIDQRAVVARPDREITQDRPGQHRGRRACPLFYLFNIEGRIPEGHLLRQII